MFLVSFGFFKVLANQEKVSVVYSEGTIKSFEKEEAKEKKLGFLMAGGSENIV